MSVAAAGTSFHSESDKVMKKLDQDFKKTSDKLKTNFDTLKKKSKVLRAEVQNVREANNRESRVDGRFALKRRKSLREKLNEGKTFEKR